MDSKRVKDVMLPLDDVPTIRDDATLAEAVRALARAQDRRPEGRLPYRAVLVVNRRGEVVGKLGHLAFLQALEPGYDCPADRAALAQAGVDPVLADSLSRHKRFWETDLELSCRRAAHRHVADVMRQIEDCIEEQASLVEGISALVQGGTLSMLVRRRDQIVGLLRLADVYDEVARLIAQEAQASESAE